jgi:hypothetical protein
MSLSHLELSRGRPGDLLQRRCLRGGSSPIWFYRTRHCVHTACVRALGVHDACAHTTVCLCAHDVGACIHPAPSQWCTGHCFSATTIWRAHVHTGCVRACVRACTRRACVHTACIRASIQRCCHCAQAAAIALPSSQPAQMLPLPLCAAPLGFTRGPDYATCHCDAAAVASCTWRPQPGGRNHSRRSLQLLQPHPCSCCNRIRDFAAVTAPPCCCSAPTLPPFCAGCLADETALNFGPA